MNQIKKSIISLNAQTIFKFFSLGLFTFFYILSLRFVTVYLLAMSSPLGLAALVGLLSVCLFAWFFPGYSLLLLVAFSPLAVGVTSILGLEAAPVIEFGFCAVFISWYIKRVIGQRVSIVPQSIVEYLVDLLAAVAALSLIYQLLQYPFDFVLIRSLYPTVSGIEDPFWVLEASVKFLAGLFLFRITLLEFRNHSFFPKLVMGVVIVQTSVLIGFAGYEVFEQIISGRSFDRVRLELPFTNPNPVAHYAVFFALFWLGMAIPWMKKARWSNLAALIPALSILLIVFITQSRTGWMAVTLTILGLIFFKVSFKKKAGILVLLLICGYILNIFSDDLLESKNRYVTRIASFAVVEQIPENRGLIFRKAIWETAVNAIAQNPVTGTGIGSYFRVSKYYMNESQQEVILPSWSSRDWGPRGNAHNYYLQLGAELGLTGLLLFLGILFLVYYKGVKQIKGHSDSDFYIKGLMLGLTALLFTGLTDHSLFPPSHSLLFWFVMASIVILANHDSGEIFQLENKKILYAGSALLILLLMAGYFTKTFSRSPEIFEYGYHPRYDRIEGMKLRWTMPDSFTETLAKSDKFSITFYADPDKVEQEVIKADIFFYDQHVDQVAWEKEEIIFRCYDVPGISGEVLKIRIKSSQSYNPYKQGFSDDIRQNRLQSLAVSDVQFFRIPLPEDKYQCQTINLYFQ